MSKCNYYENAVREDFECPNAGVTLEYLRSAQADLNDLHSALAAAITRAEAAEARAARVDEYASYYAAAWEAFEADSDGPEPLCFAEWLAQQCEVQS